MSVVADAEGETKWMTVSQQVYSQVEKGKSYKIGGIRFKVLKKEESSGQKSAAGLYTGGPMIKVRELGEKRGDSVPTTIQMIADGVKNLVGRMDAYTARRADADSFAKGESVSYQKNKNERGNAKIKMLSTAKKNHYYIETETEGTLLVPVSELTKGRADADKFPAKEIKAALKTNDLLT